MMLLFGGLQPADAQDTDLSLRGIVRAVDEAWISTDIDARITSLGFREGERFNAGEVLATFDCGDLKAQLKSAEAVLRSEQLTVENNKRLAKLNAAGKFEVTLSEAKAAQAEGEVETIRSKLSRCVIVAPFSGRIAVMRAHAHEFPDRSTPLMQIVGDKNLEIDVLLPSIWLTWLSTGTTFTIALDEADASLAAEITRIAAIVDPVSQTVKITGHFVDDVSDVLPGMSGTASFTVPHD